MFQQDSGPGHTAKSILEHITARGVIPIFWPAFSSDLSPIETLWNRMKDILQEQDPEVHKNYKRLRTAVWKAWCKT
jgi:transposase